MKLSQVEWLKKYPAETLDARSLRILLQIALSGEGQIYMDEEMKKENDWSIQVIRGELKQRKMSDK